MSVTLGCRRRPAHSGRLVHLSPDLSGTDVIAAGVPTANGCWDFFIKMLF
jgi:hypothetical protein